jgi:hypothetical protein
MANVIFDLIHDVVTTCKHFSPLGHSKEKLAAIFVMTLDFDSVTEILQYRLTQLLPSQSLSVKFVAPTTLKLRTAMPQPQVREIRSIFQALQHCRDLLADLQIETIALYGLRDNRVILWKKSFPLAQVLEDPENNDNTDLFSFNNNYVNRCSLPIAFLLSAILHWIGLDLLLFGMRLWIHEFCHAIVAWFSGRAATPLPFGWTNVNPDRSPIVYICFLTLWGLLFYTGWREQKRWSMGIAILATIVQFGMTWFMSQDTFEMWLAFGGVGGEFYVSMLLVIGFYLPLPDRWRWDFWRYPALFMGASTFFNTFSFWHQVKWGTADIPWGSLLGGGGDAGGDMNQLHDLGWSDGQIINTYIAIGHVCLWVTIGMYIMRSIDWHRKDLKI